jgi:hypothetical protein
MERKENEMSENARAETLREWKLEQAVAMAEEIRLPALGKLPDDRRVRDAVVGLGKIISLLAGAHIERLGGELVGEERVRSVRLIAASVKHLLEGHEETSPFDALLATELSVEAVADAFGQSPDVRRENGRRAIESASLAIEMVEGITDPYLHCIARGARLLAEGTIETQAPGQGVSAARAEELPYPPQPIMITPHGAVPLPFTALDGGSGQCRDLDLGETEGVLCLYEDHVGFHPDRGGYHSWPYGEIDGYSLTGGWMRLFGMRNLTLRAHGHRVRFRVGSMLAANADHVLRTAGVLPG